MRNPDARWGQMQDARRAGQAALPISWWQESRPENTRGPGENCRGAAAALDKVAGREGETSRLSIDRLTATAAGHHTLELSEGSARGGLLIEGWASFQSANWASFRPALTGNFY